MNALLRSIILSQVEDVNDNAPLTSDPIYHPVVMENSPKDVSVIRIQAQDPDLTATPSRLSYRITAGNPQNFFSINPKTGEDERQVIAFEPKQALWLTAASPQRKIIFVFKIPVCHHAPPSSLPRDKSTTQKESLVCPHKLNI